MTSADEIADAFCTYLNAQEFSIEVQFANPPDLPQLDLIDGEVAGQVYPYEETEETIDRGDGYLATRTVQMVLNGPLTEDMTRKKYLAWLNEIKETFRELVVSTSWRFASCETVSLYDFEAIKRNQFLSLLRITFRNVC